ncbi:HlyD family secretion protein [Dinghuibacter silviterrae]|uniref:Multidrug resistance efflux pump n=1 Tax=Dinghuibacter silviterrae TaxID=1539049 RepID=A0A4R8DHR6_9BACT|nr:HlyD family secretion protein [Dinghuibacter silviterrae]TDW96666.1 multidrug resistance efflux pump [Dinghuibacter silviterrae]
MENPGVYGGTESLHDIIGKMPGRILSWGLLSILLLMGILLVFAWIIKYPDILTARVQITSSNPPVSVVAESDGRIQLTVQDDNSIHKGDVLGIIENPARSEDVFYIKALLNNFLDSLALPNQFSQHRVRTNLQLGEIQTDFANFQKQYEDYLFYIRGNLQQNGILASKAKIGDYQRLLGKYDSLNDLSARDADLTRQDYTRNKQLKDGNVISAQDLEKDERVLIESRKNKQQEDINVLNAGLRIAELNNDVRSYEIEFRQNMELYTSNLAEVIKKINADIIAWEYKYVLRSVTDGKTSFLNIWKNNQYVKKGDVIMVLIPEQSDELIGKALIPIQNSGKIRPGQRVQIKLDSHPYYEYGSIWGVVGSISLVPNSNNNYIVNIRLPQRLTTTYHQTIPFSPSLEGTAEIITQDRRLIGRLLFSLRQLFERK